jgi:hypothetical protein
MSCKHDLDVCPECGPFAMTPPLPTAADLQETPYDPSDDRLHVEATRVGLRHTDWRRAPYGRRNEGNGSEPW